MAHVFHLTSLFPCRLQLALLTVVLLHKVFTNVMADSLDKLNAKILSEHLHTKFKVHLEGGDTELEIVEINEPPAVPKLELFVLILRGPSSARLIQRVHRLEHETLGAFEIFLTPIAEDEQSTTYEAVFNRFRKQQS